MRWPPEGGGARSIGYPDASLRSATANRRCAETNEKILPALEAAHIRDYGDLQEHSLTNGILFRADIHKLFDAGYVTVTPDYHFEVIRRIKEEFENGRDYYAWHGSPIRLPKKAADRPAAEALFWHNEERFFGGGHGLGGETPPGQPARRQRFGGLLASGRVAVKVINHLGGEVMMVFRV